MTERGCKGSLIETAIATDAVRRRHCPPACGDGQGGERRHRGNHGALLAQRRCDELLRLGRLRKGLGRCFEALGLGQPSSSRAGTVEAMRMCQYRRDGGDRPTRRTSRPRRSAHRIRVGPARRRWSKPGDPTSSVCEEGEWRLVHFATPIASRIDACLHARLRAGLTESEGRGATVVRIKYWRDPLISMRRLRWVSEAQVTVNRGLRPMSRDL